MSYVVDGSSSYSSYEGGQGHRPDGLRTGLLSWARIVSDLLPVSFVPAMTTLDALAYVHIPKDKKKVGELPQEHSEMSVLELKRRVLLGSSLE